jgi:hypothetical protein
LILNTGSGILESTILAGNVAVYSWLSLDCPSANGWQEELVAAVGRLTTAVLRGKGRFAFVGMFPQEHDFMGFLYTEALGYINSIFLLLGSKVFIV